MLEKLLNAMKEDVLKTDFGNRQVMDEMPVVDYVQVYLDALESIK